MVAISFSKKPEFPQMIIDGIKDQTIRPFNAKRYDQIKRIKKLQLYWKQRTKECFKIADAELTEIFKIKFMVYRRRYWIFAFEEPYPPTIYSGWYPVSEYTLHEIIKRDGLTPKEFFGIFQETYGDIENVEFMVIRFKVTDIPDYSYEYAKKLAKKASEDDSLISDERMEKLDEITLQRYNRINEKYGIAKIRKVNINEVGERVLVLNGKQDKILGKGTIIEHEPFELQNTFPSGKDIIYNIPVIKLDNGDIIKGTECWWISIVEKVEEVKLTDYARNQGFQTIDDVRKKVCSKYDKYDTCSVCPYWTYSKHCTLLEKEGRK